MKRAVWEQIKNLTCEELQDALQKDGFLLEGKRGATQSYRHPDGRRVVIHYHPGKTYGGKLIEDLIDDIGWNENDLKRLKLIKR